MPGLSTSKFQYCSGRPPVQCGHKHSQARRIVPCWAPNLQNAENILSNCPLVSITWTIFRSEPRQTDGQFCGKALSTVENSWAFDNACAFRIEVLASVARPASSFQAWSSRDFIVSKSRSLNQLHCFLPCQSCAADQPFSGLLSFGSKGLGRRYSKVCFNFCTLTTGNHGKTAPKRLGASDHHVVQTHHFFREQLSD